MSLDYNYSQIADRAENYPPTADGYMNPATVGVTFATMSVKLGEITEDNWPEFAARLELFQALYGTMASVPDGEGGFRPIDWREVKGHIGLRTNVFPNATRAQFLGTLCRAHVIEDKVREIKRASENS